MNRLNGQLCEIFTLFNGNNYSLPNFTAEIDVRTLTAFMQCEDFLFPMIGYAYYRMLIPND